MEKVYSGYELEVNKNVEDIAYNGRMLKIEGNSKRKIIEEVKGKEVTGEFITVNDVELENGRITVSGNSKQETREGYNLLPNNLDSQTINNVTVTINKDKSITLNGTASAYFKLILFNDTDKPIKLSNGTYTISYKNKPTGLNLIGTENGIDVPYMASAVTTQSITKTYTSETIITKIVTAVASGTVFNNLTVYPMIYSGTEEKDYEQYGASPSSDYPSEVECCGDNINLFDKTDITENTSISVNDGTTYANNNSFSTNFIKIKGIKDICCNALSSNTTLWGATYDENKNYIKGFTTTDGILSQTVCGATYVRLGILKKYLDTTKIEKGKVATPYSPYGQGCINEVICNKNILPYIEKVNSAIETGVDFYGITYFQKVKPSTTYTISIIDNYSTGLQLYEYDDKKQFIRRITPLTGNSFITSENTKYFKFRTNDLVSKITNPNFMLEESKTLSDYIEHQSQTYTIPTQQPMRSVEDTRDTFIKKNNKWFERHYIFRKIFDGTESFAIKSQTEEYIIFEINQTGKARGFTNIICSHFKTLHSTTEECVRGSTGSSYVYINISKGRLSSIDSDGFKALLSAKYNAGTPVYVDYVLETPLDIECTEEQSTILNSLEDITIYRPVTHIIPQDETPAYLKMKYNYVDASPSPRIPSEIRSAGDNINIFDGEVEKGNIDASTGQNAVATNAWRSKNYLNVKDTSVSISIKDLTFSGTVGRLYFYKSDNTYISNILINTLPFTTALPSETAKVRFFILNSVTDINSKIKVENGKVTEYSKTGQGCINEVICNKNLWENKYAVTTEGITFYENSDGSKNISGTSTNQANLNNYINYRDTELSNGEIYTLSCNQQLPNGVEIRIEDYNGSNWVSNLIVLDKTTSTKTEKIILNGTRIKLLIRVQKGIIVNISNLKIQLEKGSKATSYEQHKKQVYTIPTQQPFRSVGNTRDTFIKKNNKWYERHIIKRIIMDGTANKFISKHSTITSDTKGFYKIELNQKNKTFQDGSVDFGLCNYLNVGGEIGAVNTFNNYNNIIWNEGRTIYIYAVLPFLTTEEANNWLSELYEKGTPVYIDYILETPLDIECTPEQEIILEKIQNIKLYDGINYIYSLDNIEALLTFEYYYKMKDYDFYLSADGYLNIPSLGIRYLVDLNESSIPNMPESVESAVRVAGRDGDVVLNTTYEPITFNIVCCTEDNLTAMEKTEQETKINSFLNSIKNRTKRFAIERNTKFYEVKYNGALTTINFPKFLKFSIPFKSSDSYGKDIVENIMIGNEKVNSNTIKEVGALITIKGPAISPIIALNDYSIEYSTDIIDGARIEIDTNKSTVTHINSDEVKTNVMKYYNHQFPKIENGENELKILSGIDDNNRVNIKWNDLKL